MENKDAFEIIETIGKQWPFLLTLFVIIVTIAKWKTIWNAVSNLSGIKIKKGEAEFQFQTKPNNTESLVVETELKKTETSEEATSGLKEETVTVFECYLRMKEGKHEEALKIFNQIQSKANHEESKENEFAFLSYKYILGSIDEYEFKNKLNEEKDQTYKSIGYKYLGLSYKWTKQYDKAIESFNQALKNITEEEEITKIIINMSQTYLNNNDLFNSESIILSKLKSTMVDSNKADLYFQLSKVYEEQKNLNQKSIVLQKAATLKGNNTSYIFDSAYSYSAADLKEAGIYQYSRLLSIDSDNAGALNNLGVNFQEMKLPLKSVEYYRKSSTLGNSLAAANLAYLLIDAGFEEEASKLFGDFINKPDVHINLINARSTLYNKKDVQQNKSDALANMGQKISGFFNKYAFFYFEGEPIISLIEDNWRNPDGNKVMLVIKESNLELSWRIPNAQIGDDDIFSINGIINNSACQVKYNIPKTNVPQSWELYIDKNKKPSRSITQLDGYCFVDLSKSKIDIMYKSEDEFKFLTFIKG